MEVPLQTIWSILYVYFIVWSIKCIVILYLILYCLNNHAGLPTEPSRSKTDKEKTDLSLEGDNKTQESSHLSQVSTKGIAEDKETGIPPKDDNTSQKPPQLDESANKKGLVERATKYVAEKGKQVVDKVVDTFKSIFNEPEVIKREKTLTIPYKASSRRYCRLIKYTPKNGGLQLNSSSQLYISLSISSKEAITTDTHLFVRFGGFNYTTEKPYDFSVKRWENSNLIFSVQLYIYVILEHLQLYTVPNTCTLLIMIYTV